MATIRIERHVSTSTDKAWDALADFGALHTRLVPGFVVDTVVEGDIRTVTFGNGMVARERLIGLDHTHRRIAYTILNDAFEHHSASNQIFPEGENACRFVWIADLLPDALAERFEPMMEAGADALERSLSRRERA